MISKKKNCAELFLQLLNAQNVESSTIFET